MTLVPLDTLTKFGTTFQTKCVVALITDRPFLEQSLDVITPKFFESEANQWIVDRILWYFSHYKSLPTVEVLKRESDKLEKQDVLRAAVVAQLKEIFYTQAAKPQDLQYIKDELLTFCKNQAIKTAVLESADLLQRGAYDQIKVIIDRAMGAGKERNLGHIYMEELELRVSKVARNVIGTPWNCVNEIMDGGLGAGELGCVIAPSGIGKSWILTAIGAAAMRQGKTVAHYTFELSEPYLGLRYDAHFTGIEPNLIKNHTDIVTQKMQSIPGKLYLKYFPTRTINVNAINAHYQQLANFGVRPDIVIIDYADLMRSAGKADARHEELGFIYEEIRGFLGENKLPGWTASQSQRSSTQDDVIEADKVAGAYSKIMACDFIISASRKMADKMTNTARVHVIKNRFGPDGMTYPAEMDLAHGRINVYDENSPEGMVLKNKINAGEGTVKAMLSKKLIDFKKPNPVD